MALIRPNINGSSISSRLNILFLITLVLISCCSSSRFSIYDVDSSSNELDDDLQYRRFINVPEPVIYPWKDPFRYLLRKSIVIQPNYRQNEYNNKRYAPQAFHAMRG